jgi:formate/nitrite transporter FocA (FNT family)
MWFPSMALASTGLEHSITNAALIPAGLFCAPHLTFLQIAQVGPLVGNLSWSSFILVNLIPSSIGNLLGGMIFPGMLLWIAYKREMAQ